MDSFAKGRSSEEDEAILLLSCSISENLSNVISNSSLCSLHYEWLELYKSRLQRDRVPSVFAILPESVSKAKNIVWMPPQRVKLTKLGEEGSVVGWHDGIEIGRCCSQRLNEPKSKWVWSTLRGRVRFICKERWKRGKRWGASCEKEPIQVVTTWKKYISWETVSPQRLCLSAKNDCNEQTCQSDGSLVLCSQRGI